MKIFSFLFFIFLPIVTMAVPPPSASKTYKEFPYKWMEMQLADCLINSEQILVCTPKIVNVYSNKEGYLSDALYELTSVSKIFDSNNDLNSLTNVKKVIPYNKDEAWIAGKPLLLPDRRYIFFLKRISINDDIRNKLKIDNDAEVLDFSKETWCSAFIIDSLKETQAKKILSKYYGIDNPEETVKVIEKLVRWRDIKRPKEERVKELVDLINSTRKERIYQDTIPKILTHLGVKIIEKGNVFVVEEQIDKK